MQKSDIDWKEWDRWVSEGAVELGIGLTPEKIRLLETFARELLEAGRSVNLTSVQDPLEVAEKLVLDSLVPGRFLPAGASVLDLGTGAGIPGIPMKIAFPAFRMTLIDGRRKRINFVKYAIRRLGLENIDAHHARAEEMAAGSERFDAVVSRAVTSIARLHRLSAPLVNKGGILIAMKGRGLVSELDQTNPAAEGPQDGANLRLETYRLPRLGIERVLAILEYTK